MKIYLVGGAVRDELLGRPIGEKDWVVVGATPEELVAKGFKPVGKDFPVFLHPKTHEEYALARTERKISKGYKGFTCYASPDVTLEEDLIRRDLTINAMAKDENGQLIDPFHGQDDLKKKILRHISPAFAEDPVRILRVARFASRFGDFTVAPETIQLMEKMVDAGEVNALVPERVWKELQRSLTESYPWRFIEILRACGALKIIFPELDTLFGVPNPPQWHPEIDTGIHTLLVLKAATKLSKDPMVRFAALLHDVGKGKTDKTLWPKHYEHCEIGGQIIRQMSQRLNIPKKYEELAILVACYHSSARKIIDATSKGILRFLKNVDAFRRPQRFEQFLLACEADVRGREGFENEEYPQAEFLKNIVKKCNQIKLTDEEKQGSGEKIAQILHQKRLDVTNGVRHQRLHQTN
ncbi:MAG: multifunctional CCA addition/repair protein [Gammaproteobacteria bacterium]|nr:multifunctional CCA addition/repair protein [Gammaproteobacteria bacterium]